MLKKIALFFLVVLCTALSADAAKKFTLVIDAGHGGKDVGARGTLTDEKTINLNVALAFGRYVERNCPDVKVIYTRKTDVFIPLHERANIANRNKADLFVSVHTNALPKGKISRGLETYTLGMHRANENLEVAKRENSVILIETDYRQRYEGFDPRSSESYIMFELMQDKNMTQSVELARLVQKKACATANRLDKGVKQAGFLVLRETSMPNRAGIHHHPRRGALPELTERRRRLGAGHLSGLCGLQEKPYGRWRHPLQGGAEAADGDHTAGGAARHSPQGEGRHCDRGAS